MSVGSQAEIRRMHAKTWRVSDSMAELSPDPWRRTTPFSDDMARCHTVLFDLGSSRQEKSDALSDWLGASQPCRFGQMEARQRRLAFCVLTENDLERSDQEMRARIEHERAAWKSQARNGSSHGFLIVAVSEVIANARPGPALHRLATNLCELYLGVDASDQIHHDDLILEIGRTGEVLELRRWKVGVNYFSAQGDRRWWHDHRIPGGMAFSMNSVGHMARTKAETALAKNADLAPQGVPREKLVYWALPTAMRTIGPRVAGRGTWLARRGTFPEDVEPPTFEQRQRYFGDLAAYSENRYLGAYHTDITIPSEYFDDGLWQLDDIGERDDLFFTYLHHLSDDAYRSMGLGEELAMDQDAGMDTIDNESTP